MFYTNILKEGAKKMTHYKHYPKKRSHYQYLHVPDHWQQYWSKYPNGFTVLEALISWTSQVNDMIKTLNKTTDHVLVLDRQFRALDKELRSAFEGFKEHVEVDQQEFKDEVNTIINNFIASIDPRIQDIVVGSLNGWLDDGTLADIINEDVFNMKADKTELVATKTLIRPDMTTVEIQFLLDTGKDFKFLAGEYLLEGREIGGNLVYLNIPSNVNIEMEQGTIINIEPSDYGNSYNRATIIFRIANKENIVIDGGVLIGDRENTTDRTGEWGYGIKVDNSSNITIKNMQLNKTWGDGIAVQEQSKDVFIHNIICDNNRRQGMTIGHVENLYVSESSFINTQGTPPAAGVDLEPSGVGYIRNIVFDKCVMRGNSGSGFEVNLVRMLDEVHNEQNENEFIKIDLNDCTFEQNGKEGIHYWAGNTEHYGVLRGLITVNNPLCKNNVASGIRLDNIKKNRYPHMVVNNAVVKGITVLRGAVYYNVNHTEDTTYGGLEINGLEIIDRSTQSNATSINVETSNDNKVDLSIIVVVDDEVPNGYLDNIAMWRNGEGRIELKGDKTQLKLSTQGRGQSNFSYLNGFTVALNYNMTLPPAGLNKGRVFKFYKDPDYDFGVRATPGESLFYKGGEYRQNGDLGMYIEIDSGQVVEIVSNGSYWISK